MPPRHKLVPKYRLHGQSGQAIVTVRMPGKRPRDVTLGKFNSPESVARYQEILAALQVGRDPTESKPHGDATNNEVMAAFWKHAEQHYRRTDGTTTNELVEYRFAFQCLRQLCGSELAGLFGPLKLQGVREIMVGRGWCRRVVNSRVRRLKHVYKWAAAQEMVAATVCHALATVTGLQKGRTAAKDYGKIAPVSDVTVEATLPYLTRPVAGLVRFQRLVGCRPDEACGLKMCEVDRSGEVWWWHVSQHKLTHRGEEKHLPIGPRAQAVLAEFIGDDPAAFVFSPRTAVAELHARRAAARKTPKYPSHMKHNAARRSKKPKRTTKERYSTHSYDKAVGRGIVLANDRRKRLSERPDLLPHWSPNQLRHARGTEARHKGGIESAQALLGHHQIETTQIYAERNRELAEKAAREHG